MRTKKTIFSQIMSLVSRYDFQKCVDRYKGDWHAKTLTCIDQFKIMSFAQFTDRSSLRDIEMSSQRCAHRFLNTNRTNKTNLLLHTDLTHTDLVRSVALTDFCTRIARIKRIFYRTRISPITRILFAALRSRFLNTNRTNLTNIFLHTNLTL